MTPVFSLTVLFALLVPANDRAEAVAPFVEEDTNAVVHLDLTRLDVEALSRWAFGEKLPAGGIEKTSEMLAELRDSLRTAGARDFYLVVNLAELDRQPPVGVVPVPEGADAEAIRKVLGAGENRG